MTELQKKFIGFIPSKTMQEYLSQMIDEGSWIPSAEDIIATVYQSDRNIFEKSDFFRLLLDEKLSESTRKQLEDIVRVQENVREYMDSSRYAFECEDRDGRVYIFNGIRHTMKFLRKHTRWYTRVIDKQKRGNKRYISELYIEGFEIVEVSAVDGENTIHNKSGDKYVKFPIPFEVGDVVHFTEDKKGLFCVVNTELPSIEMNGTNFIDSSITVIPYEYREYATPELAREHYERCKSPSTYVHDVITEQHEHMSVIYTELYQKYDKGE